MKISYKYSQDGANAAKQRRSLELKFRVRASVDVMSSPTTPRMNQ